MKDLELQACRTASQWKKQLEFQAYGAKNHVKKVSIRVTVWYFYKGALWPIRRKLQGRHDRLAIGLASSTGCRTKLTSAGENAPNRLSREHNTPPA
ncbi:MAG: hypothetical protein CMK83_26030 [Pseudomonadales bacterium]|jgi:ACT domain-containing protein|nr:hypothetical protein [Pseudomonadales bacterium]RLT91478.1 MAG: hypothetical protein D9N13_03845 [Ketobacter sp. GenoA1]RLT96242.1 MAG: hypothetical protein D9N15_12375 [Ketobacter sp.]HAG96024.1 hypothetical protein [Gammaproteobacteria bacterium]MBI26035.1 hypothetical protein [Pseudomonadales bacterium]|tara:strand:+ start:168 stop:455 length:288 start_codon:yes stop_codon:yes gene_type:complete